VIPREELMRALSVCQPIAIVLHPRLQACTRRMLFALDRYWQAEETSWDRLWWETYERERAKVEALL
jgi:hypothetical protein